LELTLEADYEGYGWIKVKRAEAKWAGDIDPATKVVPEEHHVEETTFLIEEVRKLAKRVDQQAAALRGYRRQEEQRQRQASRQARWDQDYLPYQEDDEGR
jgi:hypothetical protein